MKALVVGDVHYAQYSSILRKRGNYYSQRLENLLWSINWAEKTALDNGVDKIIYLGDFFDRADLNAEELTAFRDIVWAKDIPHIFIVGNHEIASHTLEYSSAHLINSLGPNFTIVDKPMEDVGFGYRFIYLPYIFENNRKTLQEYIDDAIIKHGYVETQEVKQLYIFSHNDIKGVQYGAFESQNGFDRDEILNSHCRYFINGHIHNQGWIVKDKIINLGNLTGQNFNEDGLLYPHTVALLDTSHEPSLKLIKNPYALHFLKLEVNSLQDMEYFPKLTHMVLSIKCREELVEKLREFLDNCEDVEEYRVISTKDQEEMLDEGNVQVFNSIDHLEQFQSYIINQLGKTDLVLKELQEVTK